MATATAPTGEAGRSMSQRPYGMEADIEVSFTMKGPADAVMRDIRRLRETNTHRRASVTLLAFAPGHGASRYREQLTLPVITEGESSGAMQQLDRLAQQSRIDANTEQQLDELIRELADRTTLIPN